MQRAPPVSRLCLPLLGQADRRAAGDALPHHRLVRYRKGERVHSPVENCVGILLLRTGQFRAYLLSDDGRDVTLYRLFGGEICILSASCVMDSVNFDLYIDAEEDTEATASAQRLPQSHAAERGGAVLRLPDDR